ncbi:hypothetical protein CDAR_525191 [Caerostris darwini]|uniref:RING-type domain-containing protein n=1 Tax=Caerostris darwini TaxID=1538125 RepID=A0AAV4Q135_9ARAC|nr:hypothetical protein CDAR_525191 [Caerostris darwini]
MGKRRFKISLEDALLCESHNSLYPYRIFKYRYMKPRCSKLKRVKNMRSTMRYDSSFFCAVCQTSKQRQKWTELVCCHVFHSTCILRWFKNDDKCPICRF